MEPRNDALESTTTEQDYNALVRENGELRAELAAVHQQLAWFKRQLFGAKSEKRRIEEPPGQTNLLGHLASPSAPAAAAEEETVRRRRKKKQRGEQCVTESGLRFDASVPVEVIEVPAPELNGPEAEHFEVIAYKDTHRLAQRPGSYVVLHYRQPVVKDRRSETVKTTPAPANVLERSVADVSLLAGMLVDKFCWHLPLYRQHQRLQAAGFELARASLTQWVTRAVALLEPIYEAQLAAILAGDVLAMDETVIKAGREGQGKMRNAYLWPIYGEHDEVAFTYASGRGAEHIGEVLDDRFAGVLLTDGYEPYASYAAAHPEITHAECWVHTRRGFERALDAEPQAAREALERVGAIYAIDAEIREAGLTGAAKLEIRQRDSARAVEAFWAWCKQQSERLDLEPRNPLTKALKYAQARRKALEVFLANPAVAPDTNHLERSIRPIACGRKNFLFCWTELGAKHLGIIQSLIATCRRHGLDPYTYLVDVLQRIAIHPASRVAELTPRRWKALFAGEPLRSALDRAHLDTS